MKVRENQIDEVNFEIREFVFCNYKVSLASANDPCFLKCEKEKNEKRTEGAKKQDSTAK